MDEFIEKKVKSRPKRSYDKSFVDPKILSSIKKRNKKRKTKKEN